MEADVVPRVLAPADPIRRRAGRVSPRTRCSMTSRLRAWIDRVEHNFVLGPPVAQPRRRPEIAEPGGRAVVSARRRWAASASAVVLPAATATALLPARADHSQITAVVLVLPVVAVAVLGAFGPALVAAIVAGIAYDVLHTEPYGHVVVDDPDDIVTTVALVAVAVAVGGLCSRVVRLQARAAGRGAEIQHLTEFADAAVGSASVEALTGEACHHLVALLDLRHCRWQADYHGQAAPTLLADGRSPVTTGLIRLSSRRTSSFRQSPGAASSVGSSCRPAAGHRSLSRSVRRRQRSPPCSRMPLTAAPEPCRRTCALDR